MKRIQEWNEVKVEGKQGADMGEMTQRSLRTNFKTTRWHQNSQSYITHPKLEGGENDKQTGGEVTE